LEIRRVLRTSRRCPIWLLERDYPSSLYAVQFLSPSFPPHTHKGPSLRRWGERNRILEKVLGEVEGT